MSERARVSDVFDTDTLPKFKCLCFIGDIICFPQDVIEQTLVVSTSYEFRILQMDYTKSCPYLMLFIQSHGCWDFLLINVLSFISVTGREIAE